MDNYEVKACRQTWLDPKGDKYNEKTWIAKKRMEMKWREIRAVRSECKHAEYIKDMKLSRIKSNYRKRLLSGIPY